MHLVLINSPQSLEHDGARYLDNRPGFEILHNSAGGIGDRKRSRYLPRNRDEEFTEYLCRENTNLLNPDSFQDIYRSLAFRSLRSIVRVHEDVRVNEKNGQGAPRRVPRESRFVAY